LQLNKESQEGNDNRKQKAWTNHQDYDEILRRYSREKAEEKDSRKGFGGSARGADVRRVLRRGRGGREESLGGVTLPIVEEEIVEGRRERCNRKNLRIIGGNGSWVLITGGLSGGRRPAEGVSWGKRLKVKWGVVMWANSTCEWGEKLTRIRGIERGKLTKSQNWTNELTGSDLKGSGKGVIGGKKESAEWGRH